MRKIFGVAGAIALSIIPTPSFSGEVEQEEVMSNEEAYRQMNRRMREHTEQINRMDVEMRRMFEDVEARDCIQALGAPPC